MSSDVMTAAEQQAESELELLWLEITGKCQLQCGLHCYAESGPDGDHGVMEVADWVRVIDQAAELGVATVQFIGGEPTLHPALAEMIDRVLGHGAEVEVYSNLVHVPKPLWDVLRQPRVRLATSYYSDDPKQHKLIVGGRPTLACTEANILKAQELGIPLRAGLVRILDDQRIDGAIARLRELGVDNLQTDDVRGVGRGTTETPKLNALCGECAGGRMAILPSGDAHPCVFSRWQGMCVGNVRSQPLAEILDGEPLSNVRDTIRQTLRPPCNPDHGCDPTEGNGCTPKTCDPTKDFTNRDPSHTRRQ